MTDRERTTCAHGIPAGQCGNCLAFGAASQPPIPQPMQDVAWLIERPQQGAEPPEWWCGAYIDTWKSAGSGWTFDANAAVRFARKEDAERVRALLPNGDKLVATEHLWFAEAEHEL